MNFQKSDLISPNLPAVEDDDSFFRGVILILDRGSKCEACFFRSSEDMLRHLTYYFGMPSSKMPLGNNFVTSV